MFGVLGRDEARGCMLPDDEINRLTEATECADRLAATGRLVDGYVVLVAG
jgi:hypothetical protein